MILAPVEYGFLLAPENNCLPPALLSGRNVTAKMKKKVKNLRFDSQTFFWTKDLYVINMDICSLGKSTSITLNTFLLLKNKIQFVLFHFYKYRKFYSYIFKIRFKSLNKAQTLSDATPPIEKVSPI